MGISGLGEDWGGERKEKMEEKPERDNESKGTQWKQVVRCSMKTKLRNHSGAACHSQGLQGSRLEGPVKWTRGN